MGVCLGCDRAKRNRVVPKTERNVTLAILGLDNAGKTTIVKVLQSAPANETVPTIGFTCEQFQIEKHVVTIYDLGGGEWIRNIWHNYYTDVHGIIYVVDSSQPSRLSESRVALESVLSDPHVVSKPCLILANKQDVSASATVDTVRNLLQIDSSSASNAEFFNICGCSALDPSTQQPNTQLLDGVRWLLRVIDERFESLDARVQRDVNERRAREKQEKAERAERVRIIREQREAEEAAERAKRGEPEISEDVDDSDVGDPFKPISRSKRAVEAVHVPAVKQSDALKRSANKLERIPSQSLSEVQPAAPLASVDAPATSSRPPSTTDSFTRQSPVDKVRSITRSLDSGLETVEVTPSTAVGRIFDSGRHSSTVNRQLSLTPSIEDSDAAPTPAVVTSRDERMSLSSLKVRHSSVDGKADTVSGVDVSGSGSVGASARSVAGSSVTSSASHVPPGLLPPLQTDRGRRKKRHGKPKRNQTTPMPANGHASRPTDPALRPRSAGSARSHELFFAESVRQQFELQKADCGAVGGGMGGATDRTTTSGSSWCVLGSSDRAVGGAMGGATAVVASSDQLTGGARTLEKTAGVETLGELETDDNLDDDVVVVSTRRSTRRSKDVDSKLLQDEFDSSMLPADLYGRNTFDASSLQLNSDSTDALT